MEIEEENEFYDENIDNEEEHHEFHFYKYDEHLNYYRYSTLEKEIKTRFRII